MKMVVNKAINVRKIFANSSLVLGTVLFFVSNDW